MDADNKFQTKAEVEEYIENNIAQWISNFRLNDWKPYLEFVRISSNGNSFTTFASCEVSLNYREAIIAVDSERFVGSTEAEVRRTIEHELLHIVHAPTDKLENFVLSVIGDDPKLRDVWYGIYDDVCEDLVRGMEALVEETRSTIVLELDIPEESQSTSEVIGNPANVGSTKKDRIGFNKKSCTPPRQSTRTVQSKRLSIRNRPIQ